MTPSPLRQVIYPCHKRTHEIHKKMVLSIGPFPEAHLLVGPCLMSSASVLMLLAAIFNDFGREGLIRTSHAPLWGRRGTRYGTKGGKALSRLLSKGWPPEMGKLTKFGQ